MPDSSDYYKQNNYINGTIKSIIFASNICLGFALDIDVAECVPALTIYRNNSA